MKYKNIYKHLIKKGRNRTYALSVVCACAKVTLDDIAKEEGSGSESHIKLVLDGFLPIREPLRHAYQFRIS